MPTVTKREVAPRDLVEHFVYLAESAVLDVAEQFLSNAEASFGDLAHQMPGDSRPMARIAGSLPDNPGLRHSWMKLIRNKHRNHLRPDGL